MTTFYKKENGKYIEVSEYDSELLNSIPVGHHLLTNLPGKKLTRFNIDPAIAPLLAAGELCIDQIGESIRQSTELRPHLKNREMTLQERTRWLKALDNLPKDMRYLVTHGSAREAAEQGIYALAKEAEKFLSNPSVKKAYDHFILMCKLANEETNK